MRTRVGRLLRRAAIALGVLVGVVLVGAELLLHTPAVRGWLRPKIEALASSALDTRVEIDRLESASLVHARAGGVRIFDRGGRVIAKAATLDVVVSPTWLIAGRLRLPAIVLDYAYVDLGAPLDDEPGGLLALFESTSDEPSTKATSSALRIELPSVRVLHTRVDAVLAGTHYSARDVDADVGLWIEPGVAARIRQARWVLLRDARAIVSLESLEGERKRTGETDARLTASVGGTPLTASAKLGAESARAQGLTVDAHVSDLSRNTLAQLGVDGVWLTAPIAATLHAAGTTRALSYQLAVATPGGAIDAAGDFSAPGSLRATLRVNELEAWRFSSAPRAKLSGELRASAELGADSSSTKLALALEGARYDDTVLPKVDAHGQWDGTRGLTIEHFAAAYDDGSVSGSGHYEPDGALELLAHVQSPALAKLPPLQHVRPRLSGALTGDVCLRKHGDAALETSFALALQEPAVGTTHAAAVRIEGEIRGSSLDDARVQARVDGTGVHAGDVEVAKAELRVEGGPTRYVAAGRFGDKGRLDVALTRDHSRFDVDASAHLVVDRYDNALDAWISDFRYAPDAVSVRALRVGYLGAYVEAAGRLDKTGGRRRTWHDGRCELSANVRAADLRPITEPWLQEPISGALDARVALKGTLDAPTFRADARYHDGSLHGVSIKTATLAARADPQQRTLQLDVRAEELRGGSLEANVHSRLPHGALSLAGLRQAEHEVSLRVQRIPLAAIDEWPHGRLMPVDVQLSGELHAKGTLDAPAIDARVETNLLFKGEDAPLAVAVTGHYDPSALALDLNAQDARGPLLRTQVKTTLERGALALDTAGVARFIAERSWQASVWLGARRIDQLPGVRALGLPEALWPAQISASGKLAHEPGREPEGTLQAQAMWDPPGRTIGTQSCGLSRRPRVQLDAALQQGEVQAKLDASVAGRPMLAAKGHSDAPVDHWLRGSTERVQNVNLSVKATALRLQDLPIVCEHASGFVDGTAELERSASSGVRAAADLSARELRFGDAPLVTAKLTAHADRQLLISDATLRTTGGGSARIAARVPIDGSGRVPTLALDAPLQADIDLQKIDARALLGPITAVRTTGGHLEGRIGVRGSLRSPTLQGSLAMRDVSLTLAEAGQRFEHVSGKLTLDGRHVHLDPTRVHDRNGSIEVSGDATLIDMRSWQAELRAKAKRFRVRRSGVVLALLDGTLDVSANVEPAARQIDVTLANGRVQLTDESLSSVQSLDEHPDVTFIDDGPPAKADRPATESAPVLLRFQSKNPFWIRRSDFSALVTTQLRIEVHDGKSALSGPVEIERGFVELLGQMFDIDHGKITFTGGYQIAPTLELVAKRDIPGGAVVTIKASGELYDPQLSFELDGRPVTAAEAMSAATGAASGTGNDATVRDELSSMAAGIAGSVLTLGARRELGDWVPVLAIEHNQNQTRVRAGIEADRFIPRFLRHLVVDAYVEGIFAADSPDAQPSSSSQAAAQGSQGLQAEAGVLLELRFPKHLIGEAQYGPGQQWSLDLNYQP